MRTQVIVIAALLAGFTAPLRADIYTFVDERGVRHFTNVPQDGRYRFYMREPGAAAGEAPPPRSRNLAPRPVPPEVIAAYGPHIERAALANRLDPKLLHAVIHTESGYNPRAVSPKGALGLMQLMPDTARRYGVGNAFDPAQNIAGGARYLADLLALFAHNLDLALAAYNAGEAAVARHGNRIPPYAETRAYVPRVLARYHALRRAAARPS